MSFASMKGALSRMEYRVALAITASVFLAFSIGPYLLSRLHYDQVLDTFRTTTRTQSDLIRAALEHQMMEADRELIARMVTRFAQDPNIDSVRILDRAGKVAFSSAGDVGASWSLDSPTCRACHDRPAAQRQQSAVIETHQGTILRSVVPIENQPDCQTCHGADHRINGVLIVDVRAGQIRALLDRDVARFTMISGLVGVGLLAAIGLSLRTWVGHRLRRFEVAARAIARGELARRVPETGTDTLGRMATEFNSMAESVSHLAGELTEQRTRLEKIINAIDDAIVVLDPSLKVIAANGAFLARVRLSRAELLGASCKETVGPGCMRDSCAACLCFATGARQTTILTQVDSAGSTFFEELHASPIRSGGKVISVVEVWRDITERRKAEERMAESHRLASLGMLASGFSHELNTPLATVLTCVEGILRTLEEEAPASVEERDTAVEMARIGREQLLRCRGITQQFLRLSRGQQSSSDLLALEPLVASVVRLAAPTARELGVALRAPADGPRTTVQAKELEVQQVVMNLVLNALQACARGGHVDVTVLPGGPRIRVTDDGCGLAAAELGRIFEPFYSLRQGGTGLGLFMSQDLARGWGATIEARSVPGAGSTFDVVFGQGDAPPAESA